MTSSSGRYVISYNGEIYNFLELRHLLERTGVRFRSESDTEVILAAFERWGPDCLRVSTACGASRSGIAGERRLFLSRDRFGVKPLYVVVTPRRVAFASELKAFLRLDGFEPAENIEAIRARLAGNAADHVLLRGVESLPPGHCLEASARGYSPLALVEHARPSRVRAPRSRRQAEEFRALLFDACRLRLRSDVPVATSLSGGLDSSSVVCSLATGAGRPRRLERLAPEWRRAYIAGFRGNGAGRSVPGHARRGASRRDAGRPPVLRGRRSRARGSLSLPVRGDRRVVRRRELAAVPRDAAGRRRRLPGRPWRRRAARRLRPPRAAGTHSAVRDSRCTAAEPWI